MREKQIGVTLGQLAKNKLAKVAAEQGRSLSSVCADAIETYLDKWIVGSAEEEDRTVFSGIEKKIASQKLARNNDVSYRQH